MSTGLAWSPGYRALLLLTTEKMSSFVNTLYHTTRRKSVQVVSVREVKYDDGPKQFNVLVNCSRWHLACRRETPWNLLIKKDRFLNENYLALPSNTNILTILSITNNNHRQNFHTTLNIRASHLGLTLDNTNILVHHGLLLQGQNKH